MLIACEANKRRLKVTLAKIPIIIIASFQIDNYNNSASVCRSLSTTFLSLFPFRSISVSLSCHIIEQFEIAANPKLKPLASGVWRC